MKEFSQISLLIKTNNGKGIPKRHDEKYIQNVKQKLSRNYEGKM